MQIVVILLILIRMDHSQGRTEKLIENLQRRTQASRLLPEKPQNLFQRGVYDSIANRIYRPKIEMTSKHIKKRSDSNSLDKQDEGKPLECGGVISSFPRKDIRIEEFRKILQREEKMKGKITQGSSTSVKPQFKGAESPPSRIPPYAMRILQGIPQLQVLQALYDGLGIPGPLRLMSWI
ncbi:unnamed protein product [Cylicocyclus nassatus]|uniref:Uncharacterized protein n=1 Tax=Cylicocyclus nassatus TaxID=53992 RepID=A0AA36GHZ7_CYLNA|nr:unnamed protein product [Cylicocyclus nassatus]